MQSRSEAVFETLFSTAVGFIINLIANWIFFPLFGWEIQAHQNLLLVLIYTGISVARGYFIRRYFNYRLTKRLANKF